MNVIISESQSDKFIKTLEKFINSQSFKGVCDIIIDYNEQFDRFDLNVFFDKKFLINLGIKSSYIKEIFINKYKYETYIK